jgi:SPP1 family predicted phage head-tail adaptor
MHAGLLDKQITIQVRTQDQDAAGQPIETWATFAIVYAKIEPLVGRDYLAARQLIDEISHDITIRYRRGIKPKMRIFYLGRYFEIVAPPIDPDERREWLYLKCKEVVSD